MHVGQEQQLQETTCPVEAVRGHSAPTTNFGTSLFNSEANRSMKLKFGMQINMKRNRGVSLKPEGVFRGHSAPTQNFGTPLYLPS